MAKKKSVKTKLKPRPRPSVKKPEVDKFEDRDLSPEETSNLLARLTGLPKPLSLVRIHQLGVTGMLRSDDHKIGKSMRKTYRESSVYKLAQFRLHKRVQRKNRANFKTDERFLTKGEVKRLLGKHYTKSVSNILEPVRGKYNYEAVINVLQSA